MGEAILTTRPSSGGSNGGSSAIGDILTTARTDLGEDYLLCNGAYISSNDYPELVETLQQFTDTITISRTQISSFFDIKTNLYYIYDYPNNTIYKYDNIADFFENNTDNAISITINSSYVLLGILYVHNNKIVGLYKNGSFNYMCTINDDGSISNFFTSTRNNSKNICVYFTDTCIYLTISEKVSSSTGYRFYVYRSLDNGDNFTLIFCKTETSRSFALSLFVDNGKLFLTGLDGNGSNMTYSINESDILNSDSTALFSSSSGAISVNPSWFNNNYSGITCYDTSYILCSSTNNTSSSTTLNVKFYKNPSASKLPSISDDVYYSYIKAK